jgi:DNA-binding NarL/FixJ family response regulator
LKVLIADDQRILREGLATLVGLESDMEVVGTASDGQEAYAMALECHPDVVLMDIRMPVVDGVEGTRLIRRIAPEIKVLILTTFDDSELILQALEAGANGYLLKDMPVEAIVSAIRTVYNGGTVLEREVTAKLLHELAKLQESSLHEAQPLSEQTPPGIDDLTKRELEVLMLLGQGLNNKEISDRLFVSEGTAKNHVSNIMNKLNLRNRTQAAIYSVHHKISHQP